MRHLEANRVGCTPQCATRLEIDADHEGVFACRGKHQLVALDEGTLSCVPERNLCAEPFLHVNAPSHLACGLVTAHDVSFGTYGDNQTLANRRDGA